MIDSNDSVVIKLKASRSKLSKEVASSTLHTTGKIRNIDTDDVIEAADECYEDVKFIKSRIDESRKLVLKKYSQ